MCAYTLISVYAHTHAPKLGAYVCVLTHQLVCMRRYVCVREEGVRCSLLGKREERCGVVVEEVEEKEMEVGVRGSQAAVDPACLLPRSAWRA